MMDFSKKKFFMALALTITFAQMAKADATCPSDIVKPFVGTWEGKAILIPDHAAQLEQGTHAEFAIVDCQSFDATFKYLDVAGKVVRTVQFGASADEAQVGLFAITTGTVTDASGVTQMSGTFKQIQE